MTKSMNIDDLHAGIDLNGQELTVGSLVRSHDFSLPMREGQGVAGLDIEGERASYIEGTIEAIGEMIEGCPRYKIRASKRIFGGKDLTIPKGAPAYSFPPVNGTRASLGGRTTWVYAIMPSCEWENSNGLHYRLMPEMTIKECLSEERNMITVTQDGGKWWLHVDGVQGEDPWPTLQLAKHSGDAFLKEMEGRQTESLLVDAGLSNEWQVRFGDGLSFVNEKQELELIPEMLAGSVQWSLYQGDTLVTGSKQSAQEALLSLPRV